MNNKSRAITLIELVVCIVLLATLVLGVSSIILFAQTQATAAYRRAKVQHEVATALEHISKNLPRAVGNETVNGADSVIYYTDGSDSLYFRIDDTADVYLDCAQRQNSLGNGQVGDYDSWGRYRLIHADNPNVQTIRFVRVFDPASGYGSVVCPQENDWTAEIARKIVKFEVEKPLTNGILGNNYVTVRITGCWDPGSLKGSFFTLQDAQRDAFLAANPNGTSENPCVTMVNRINMPSVGIN